jgi:MFS family permease
MMFNTAYKRYALAVITAVYTLNMFDRGLIFILLQPIKEDLQLSDTQLGFVTGIAFGVFYATLGIPIARWTDRGNRVTITSLAIGLWGLTAMACIFVNNFVHLLLARVAAGVGDSGVQPPTYSLLGDYFPGTAERTRAMYVWYAAAPLACLLSFSTAGWINEHYGWRLAFFVTGVLGLVLSVIVKLTVAEPRKTMQKSATAAPPTSFKDVLNLLWHQPSCRHLTIAMILIFTVGQGALTWQAAFMIRTHGIGTAELGLWMGLITGLGGVASVALGWYVVDRWFAGNEQGQMRLVGIAVASAAPIFLAFLTLPTKELALGALLLQTAVFSGFTAPLYVVLQRLVPDNMRATMLMVVLFLANLIGMGIGPLLVGTMSDLLRPHFGEDALRLAMLFMSVLWLLAGYHVFRVGRTIDEDLGRAEVCRSVAV